METKPLTDSNGTVFAPQTNIDSIEDLKPELDKRDNAILSTFTITGKPLWEGVADLHEGTTITIPKKLAECVTGWYLIFCEYDTVAKKPLYYNLTTISLHKAITLNGNINGHSMKISALIDGGSAYKKIIVNNEKIFGSDENWTDKNSSVVLIGVYEY